MVSTAHIVVCGGGLSGLVAAVSAAESGASVVVLEKGPRIGGSAAISGGLVWTPEPPVEHQEHDLGSTELKNLVRQTLPSAIEWLRASGGDVSGSPMDIVGGWGFSIHPRQVVARLAARLGELGGQIRVGVGMRRITEDGGRVVGVLCDGAARSAELIPADAVVLCTGGFQANPSLVSRYLGVPPENLYLRANPWSTGDGLVSAEALGGALTSGLDGFYGHAMIAAPGSFNQNFFADVSQYQGTVCVAVNLDGRRFADESLGVGEEALNQHLARQPGGIGAYICDDRVSQMMINGGRRQVAAVFERAKAFGGTVIEASDLDGLAEGLKTSGFHRQNLIATIQDFNDACLSDGSRDLSPPRARFREPVIESPFRAVVVKAAITFSAGGLAVDEKMRVLRRSMSSSPMGKFITDVDEVRQFPIPGLLAAGCDVGGIHHGYYMGGLATALTTGRIAGREASYPQSLDVEVKS